MDESDGNRLARIEENVQAIRDDIRALHPVVAMVHKHETKIELLKRDGKWWFIIFGGISGFIGAASVLAVEFFRK